MAERELEVDVYEFLERIQLEQFFEKIDKVLHLTRLSHFEHVSESDLLDISMSKPEQRRLLDAIKKHKKERKKASKTRFSLRKSKKKESSPSFGNSSPAKPGQGKSCLINESSLKILAELGDGAFGVVHKGEWTPNKGSKVPVAVKCLKFSDQDAFLREQDNFMREACAMSDLDHPNVIHLYGVVLATPIKLVMELAPLGSLHDRLRTEPQKFLISTLYDFVLQVASGMSYLESKRYVHRDVAARNILLASYDKVKIGDCGLMRLLPTEDDVYVMNPTGKVPVAWCAPECLKNREFSLASDVWAFGVTVIEIFSYGKSPWDGLSAVQILNIIDEPANGRPGKPDHCPDKLYSLLFEHCWDPNPKERSKFSCIKEKLQEATPEDVSVFFDLGKETNHNNLVAKAGDLLTVITWKSRLGTEFAKGQNKRTAEVGYFPSSQVTRNILKNKSSGLKPRIAKVKDISPPLDNSFSHCAHRGHGDSPNWGSIMSEERQILGKHHPLNLPTKLISLNNSDGDSQIQNEDSGEIETCSIMSQDSQRSWADSGYYSNYSNNRDTYMSQDYELMTGSNPITIPGHSPQGRYPTPGTFAPQYARRPSGASLQFDPYYGQRCRGDSVDSEGHPLELRPPLPAKQVINRGRPGNEFTYENVCEVPVIKYENISRIVSPRVSERLSLSPRVSEEPPSPECVYVNQSEMKIKESVGFMNINYPIYDRPAIENRYDCQKSGRCNSLPEFELRNMKNKLSASREQKRNSFCLDRVLPLYQLNESRSAPVLDREVKATPNSENWETRTPDEAFSEEIYENIEIYNVPQTIISEIPPPLPVKRRCSEKRISVHRNSESHDVEISTKLPSTEKVFEEHYSRPVSQDVSSCFDAHLYAEISELSLDDGAFGETQSQSSFMEISKDYADLDTICAKLRADTGESANKVSQPAENTDLQPTENFSETQDKLTPFESETRTKEQDEVLWKRFSTNQLRIQRHTRRSLATRRPISGDDHVLKTDRHRSSSTSTQSLSTKLCSDLEQTLHTCATLVTTV